MLVAAEALEADDAGRPRAEAALALEPADDGVGRQVVEALELEARGRAGRAPRRAARAARAGAARTAPTAASAEVVGGSLRPVAATVTSASRLCSARITERSSVRAVFESMSWPQTARRSACATVAVRTGRSPRRCFVARPSSGSSAKRRRNSEWSSSSASIQRSFSAAVADSDRIVTRAVRRLKRTGDARRTPSRDEGPRAPAASRRRRAAPRARASTDRAGGRRFRPRPRAYCLAWTRLQRASCGGARPGPTVGEVARPLTPLDVGLGAAARRGCASSFFAHGHAARTADAILADPVRTPGVLNPDVTQANIRSTICRHGWTSTIRPPVDVHERAQAEADARSTARRARCPTTRRIT